ncbi:hypothetical protein SAMN05421690_104111 [Nitrosomonas sp. Nm51]|uniref:hypothetical protein n=1 Tax=Nitrosomonas sp. Nm51 TaxID=133720 RepID=UPI0008C4B665|nr:hypothetical protein [Nitrosomonas sp. Nm51]SER59003.1 hypothetical protein SAMN05421690_104111 [Nitrosomonas sp. Nm51]
MQQGTARWKGLLSFQVLSTVAEHHGGALWVSLPASMVCVALFDNRTATACKARLAMCTDKLAEPGNIILIEY